MFSFGVHQSWDMCMLPWNMCMNVVMEQVHVVMGHVHACCHGTCCHGASACCHGTCACMLSWSMLSWSKCMLSWDMCMHVVMEQVHVVMGHVHVVMGHVHACCHGASACCHGTCACCHGTCALAIPGVQPRWWRPGSCSSSGWSRPFGQELRTTQLASPHCMREIPSTGPTCREVSCSRLSTGKSWTPAWCRKLWQSVPITPPRTSWGSKVFSQLAWNNGSVLFWLPPLLVDTIMPLPSTTAAGN